MFHFLSDITPPTGSTEQNVEGSAQPPQQNVVKRGRGRPRKVAAAASKSQESTQDGNATIVKCEPVDEVIAPGSVPSELSNENSSSRDGDAETHNRGRGTASRGRRGRRSAGKAAASVTYAESDDDEGTSRRRTRKDGSGTNDFDAVVVDSDESDNEVLAKKKGKQRKPAASKKRTEKKTPVVEETPEVEEVAVDPAVDPAKLVQCACCKEEMLTKAFTKHNLNKHNSLGWIVGEPPVDLSDMKSLTSILNRVLKQTKKKYLVCDICGAEKKSCLGFITHKQVCGKTLEERHMMQVTCELCGRKMMPVSLKAHMTSHSKPKLDGIILEAGRKRAAASKAKSRLSEFNEDDGLVRPLTSGKKKLLYSCPKPKRAPSKTIARWRSELLANNPAKCYHAGCPFETDNVETMKEHFKVCEFAIEPSNTYDCLVCLFKSDDEVDMRAHVAAEHPEGSGSEALVEALGESPSASEGDPSDADEPLSEDFDSDDDDRRGPKRNFMIKSKRPCHRFRFLAREDVNRSGTLETYSPTLMWTLQYRMENDSPSLFHGFMTTEEDWQLVPSSEMVQYLPATKTSVHVAFGHPESGVRFSLFDSTVVGDSSAVFVGGPVWASAWCPLPLELSVKFNVEVPQYLAVSCHREMDQSHGIYSCYTGPNVIQLWDVGSLINNEAPGVPRLAMAIVHDYGTVWRMEWCPSGAYGTAANGKLQRLGLLAAACSDGFVHIFSVCMPTELIAHIKSGQAPVYRCKPVLTLKPNSSELSQCFRVSWHRAKGHALIAGGYCDGKVALWNLENYSSLLYNKEDREMYPFHTFQAHNSVISALSLAPSEQYLMTGSRDCTVKFWNIEDTTTPITMTRKGLVTDGAWLSHWMCAMTTYDDAYLHEHSNATLIPIREFGFKPYPLLPQNSAAWCLSESGWLNSLIQGTLAGEVAINLAGQLFLGLDNEKFPTKKRLLISCTELRDVVLNADGKETLGAEVAKPTQVKEGGKSNANGKAKDNKGDKAKGKKGAKGKNAAKAKEGETDENMEEIPVAKPVDSEPVIDLKPRDYKETAQKYGINIKNHLDFKIHNIPPEVSQPMRQSNAMAQVHSEMFPITSVNQVQWNPNLKSCLWVAVGHHCGLIRLICLKYLNSKTLEKFYNKAEVVLDREHPS